MNRSLNLAANLLLLLLGILGQIYLIVDTLDCSVDLVMPLWILALCVCTWFAASFRRGILIGMPLAALILFLAYWSYGSNPSAQLIDLFDRITGVYYEHIFSPGSSYVFSDAVSSHSLVLIFLAFLLAAYQASALTSQTSRVFFSLLGSLPFFLLCISVNGSPSAPAILCILLFWLLLLVSGDNYRPSGNFWRAVFAVLLPSVILLGALLLVVDPEHYQFDARDVAISQKFDRISQTINRLFDLASEAVDAEFGPDLSGSSDFASQTADGAGRPAQTGWGDLDTGIDLTKGFDSSAAMETIFHATADTNGSIYLRVISYSDYTGTAWQNGEDAAPVSSLPFLAKAVAARADCTGHRISYDFLSPLPYACVPYASLLSDPSDSRIPADGRTSYTLDYLTIGTSFLSLHLPDADLASENSYRSYVYDSYTRLPEETRTALSALCRQAGLSAEDPDILQRAAQYIRTSGSYDLNTDVWPSDDYAVYFLTTAHRGTCIHFATAATALYRALGIPARITEGYLLQAVAGEAIAVTGANAHAWVEVYRDGIGWIPVEVTGQSTAEDLTSAASGEAGPGPGEEAGTGDPGTEHGAVNQTETASDLPVGILPSEPDARTDTDRHSEKQTCLLCLFLALLLLLSVLPLRYLFLRRKHGKALSQPDHRKAVIAIYHLAARASAFGQPVPPQIKEFAEKASFSEHEILQQDVDNAQALLAQMLHDTLPGLKPLQKLQFKYWYGLI